MVVSGEIFTELEESRVQIPYKFTLIETSMNINYQVSAVNSKREIIGKMCENATDIMKITADAVQSFCRLPPRRHQNKWFQNIVTGH